MLDDVPARRDAFERLGDVFAKLVQATGAARARQGAGVDLPDTWQMVGQRAPCRLAPRERSDARTTISSTVRIAASVSSTSSKASSRWPILAPASEDGPNAARRAFAS
jgi:hypothetical protein